MSPLSTNKPANELASGQAHTVYLGLGSNLGDRDEHLRAGLRALPDVLTVRKVSGIYDTAPELVANQPRFHNAVCEASTFASPQDVLAHLKQIEAHLGRVATVRYGPRVIDLDILTYDALTMHTPALTVPHPRIAERAFVLIPLAEIAPALHIPGLSGTVADAAAMFFQPDVRRIAPASALLGSAS